MIDSTRIVRDMEGVPTYGTGPGRGRPRLAPIPDWLARALAPVLADLAHPRPLPLGLAYESPEAAERPGEVVDLGTLHMWERGAGGGYAQTLFFAGDDADLVVELADRLQEQIVPESRAAWGEPRPRCPGHPHPMQAERHRDAAWWFCPSDHRPVARIGTVGADGALGPDGSLPGEQRGSRPVA